MRHFDLGEIIASKKLQFRRHDGTVYDVVVNLGKPVPDPQNPTRTSMCPFQIVGIGGGETKAIFGSDTMQALTLALHTLPTELSALASQENGSFTPEGDHDLGLSDACKVHIDPTA
jgi:hypothetical protein